MANAPLDPPPPEGVCVTPFYWLGLFDAWLRWHVIGRREGWVEELTPPLQSPDSKQTSTWPRRMHQQKDGPRTTDRVPWAAVLLRPRPKYLEHSRVPPSRWTLQALMPVSIGGEGGQAIAADHVPAPTANPPLPVSLLTPLHVSWSTRWDPGVVQPFWTPFPSPSPCCCHTTVEHTT